MPVYRMVVAYDGSGFRGFARQPGQPGQPELVTVQGRIEGALEKILGSKIHTSAAGRTDAGVHALAQVMSFRVDTPVPDLGALRKSLNALCAPDIAVLDLADAAEGFDARFSAVSRTYEYAILTRELPDPFSRHTTWHHPGHLDLEAMEKAAQALMGEHDFTSFGRVKEGQSPVRRITSIEIEQKEDLLLIRVSATSFLAQMVRSIVGTLVKVGEGKLSPDHLERILHARDRSDAGPVAPPQGLFLVSVEYPEELV